MSVATARATVRDLLAGAGLDRLDAELLLADALGTDRAALHRAPEAPVAPGAARRFGALAARRRAGEPAAYLLGRRGFRRLELAVDARVLIPRPETEHLVEAALTLPAGARVLDVGTGSGAVALALADERPDLDVHASDVSAGALTVARANARRLALAVTFHHADLLPPGAWDAVVANPPYVEDGAEPAWEPPLALRGGPDGLDVIRRLAAASRAVPWIALEVGAGQARAVAALLGGEVAIVRDLAGIERVVVSRRPC